MDGRHYFKVYFRDADAARKLKELRDADRRTPGDVVALLIHREYNSRFPAPAVETETEKGEQVK